MKKNADNTPTFEDGAQVKVGSREAAVLGTLEDGRVRVKFAGDQQEATIEPDKIRR